MLDFYKRRSLRKQGLNLVLQGIFVVGSVLKTLSMFRPCLCRHFDFICGVRLSPDIYWSSLFSDKMLEGVLDSVSSDWNKTTKLLGKAYNPPLCSVDGKHHRLLDASKPNRPLVVNFGSITCPVFMKKLEQFQNMVEEFQDVADFVIVYTEEAHPCDGWSLENNYNIKSHKTQSERCSAARLLTPHAPCPVLVDTMLDAANIAYGAFPIRLYIILDDHVVYQGGAGPTGYNIQEASDWLTRN